MNQVNEIVSGIAAAVEEQSSTSGEIAHNSTLVEENAVTLSKLAEDLTSAVGRFKI
ncbi:MAG: hypothetical protein JRF59_14740 [Deltaproteobacteria bacterium]|nr:hypothetical protein [Deltaproteobacteria bacterium]